MRVLGVAWFRVSGFGFRDELRLLACLGRSPGQGPGHPMELYFDYLYLQLWSSIFARCLSLNP